MKAIPWTVPFAGALVLTFALTAGSAALVSPDAAEAPFLNLARLKDLVAVRDSNHRATLLASLLSFNPV